MKALDSFSKTYLQESIEILSAIDPSEIERLALELDQARLKKGRLFILGVGGSAGHASHAVNDFRKICDWESYAPTDNVSELTARINDEGWEFSYAQWLKTSRLSSSDALLVLSVGGGDLENKVSLNLVRAMEYAKTLDCKVFGIVGREGGFTKKMASSCVVIPSLFASHVTPHTEGLCAVIWHLLVSHPLLKKSATKWESVSNASEK